MVMERKIWNVKKIQMNHAYFTHKGINHITKKLIDKDYKNIESLDLSHCQLDDEGLARLMPIFPYVKELCLADNTFTW